MKLNEKQIKERLAAIPGWRREGEQVVRDFKFADFKAAMDFVNKVSDEAEGMDHHPDIFIHDWNEVRLSVMTHSVGGLTEKDFQLSERINAVIDRP